MNDEERDTSASNRSAPAGDPDDSSASDSGVNLTLIYSLIALALVAAIVIAMFVVLPFYQRR